MRICAVGVVGITRHWSVLVVGIRHPWSLVFIDVVGIGRGSVLRPCLRSSVEISNNACLGVISKWDLGFTNPSSKSQVIYEVPPFGLAKQGIWPIEIYKSHEAQIPCLNLSSKQTLKDFFG